MSMENLNCIDSEQEESFSFPCYDSISGDDDEEESYIEIALEPTTPRHVNELEKEEELKLRVSISSKTLTTCPGEELLQDSSSSSTSSSSAGASLSSDSIVSSSSSSKWRSMVDLSNWINRFLKLLMMSTLKDSSEIINGGGGGELKGRRPQFLTTHHTSSNWDTRKTSSSKVLKAIKGGGITKLFIKLKWVKVQSKLPFIKSNKGNKKHNSSNNNNRRFEESIGQPFNKWSTHQNHRQLKENKSNNNIKNSFKVPDINLDAIKGIIEAMMGSMSIAGRKDRQLKRNSCPNSSQSSPIHNGNGTPSKESKNLSYHYTRENSVQAAIAHCKSSLDR